MILRNSLLTTTILLAVFGISASYAQEETVVQTQTTIIESPTPESQIIPQPENTNDGFSGTDSHQAEVINPENIHYISGGIGSESRDLLKTEEANFSVKILFSEPEGALLSDIHIVIKDYKGAEILGFVTEGPIVLADLKPGSYHLTASLGAQVKEKKITVVKGKKQRLSIVFNS